MSLESDDDPAGHAFHTVAYWMGAVGRCCIIAAFAAVALIFIGGINVTLLVGGLLLLVIGMVTLNAAAAFRGIEPGAEDAGDRLREATLHLRDLFRLVAFAISLEAIVVIVVVLMVTWDK